MYVLIDRQSGSISFLEDKMQAFLSMIQRGAAVVEKPPSLQIIEDNSDDNFILTCALKANTDYLISGDTHLKRLESYKGPHSVSPSEFLPSSIE